MPYYNPSIQKAEVGEHAHLLTHTRWGGAYRTRFRENRIIGRHMDCGVMMEGSGFSQRKVRGKIRNKKTNGHAAEPGGGGGGALVNSAQSQDAPTK